jgi:hypothetical protein
MLNARKACAGYGHSGESFLQGYMCQVTKDSIARMVTFLRMHIQLAISQQVEADIRPKKCKQVNMQCKYNSTQQIFWKPHG